MPFCPKCGTELEDYSKLDGGYCKVCNEWFPADIVEEHLKENE